MYMNFVMRLKLIPMLWKIDVYGILMPRDCLGDGQT